MQVPLLGMSLLLQGGPALCGSRDNRHPLMLINGERNGPNVRYFSPRALQPCMEPPPASTAPILAPFCLCQPFPSIAPVALSSPGLCTQRCFCRRVAMTNHGDTLPLSLLGQQSPPFPNGGQGEKGLRPNRFPDQAQGPKLSGAEVAKDTLVPVGAMGNSQLISGCCDDSSVLSGDECCIFQTSGFTPLLTGLKKK